MGPATRVTVRVEGVVQGVGFRPFVHGLAHRFALAGRVSNDTAGVLIDAEGATGAVERFLLAIEREAPPLACIERMSVRRRRPTGETGFRIVPSDPAGSRRTLVSVDSATCARCLAELADPADRRFRYPFINCTHCGPRFTIVRDVPYDRPGTTMAAFTMCGPCSREYHDPGDRRFHAQPVCCPDCGPRLRLVDPVGRELPGDPVDGAARLLRAGMVVAVKGLGGYHLAADAGDHRATAALRSRKHREDKPFAVMVADLDAARGLCEVDEVAAELLAGHRRPIVLLDRRPHRGISPAVAPGTRQLGVMLAYTPLHHLLLGAFAGPIVLTSGNRSDEPIAYRDADAVAALAGIADAFLVHDRAIQVRTDDSVARSWRGRPVLLRRSRGYAPEPLALPWRFRRPVLGCGAELKNTFCLGKDRRAFCSPHIGDLTNYETLRSFTEGIEHFRRLFDIAPGVVAHDLHPDYLSTTYAAELPDVDLVGVQHHHAHIASCLADNGEAGPVIGVAFDGTGYGPDGTVWGGEFLLADLVGYRRLAHLAPVPLPGGAAAVRQPWRMAASYLDAAYPDGAPALAVAHRHADGWERVRSLARSGLNTPATSSAGRLFDAVAAVLGVRDTVTYEGQAAIELEQRADRHERSGYPVEVEGAEPMRVSGAALVRQVVDDLLAGTDPAVVAARFHNAVADLVALVCRRARAATGVGSVALSGGVFQNRLLLDRAVDLLSEAGFRVLTHSRVPCNDGGVSLGQAAVAGAQDRR